MNSILKHSFWLLYFLLNNLTSYSQEKTTQKKICDIVLTIYNKELAEAKRKQMPKEVIDALEKALASIKQTYCLEESPIPTNAIEETKDNLQNENSFKKNNLALPISLQTFVATNKILVNYTTEGKQFELFIWLNKEGDALITGENLLIISRLLDNEFTADDTKPIGIRIQNKNNTIISFADTDDGKIAVSMQLPTTHTNVLNKRETIPTIYETNLLKKIAGFTCKEVSFTNNGELIKGCISIDETPNILSKSTPLTLWGLMQGFGKYANHFFVETALINNVKPLVITLKSITEENKKFEFQNYKYQSVSIPTLN